MAHIGNLMPELGPLQSTLASLDLRRRPGSCVLCTLCQMLRARHMVALGNAGCGALIRSKRTAPFYRHVARVRFFFNHFIFFCWIKSTVGNSAVRYSPLGHVRRHETRPSVAPGWPEFLHSTKTSGKIGLRFSLKNVLKKPPVTLTVWQQGHVKLHW